MIIIKKPLLIRINLVNDMPYELFYMNMIVLRLVSSENWEVLMSLRNKQKEYIYSVGAF